MLSKKLVVSAIALTVGVGVAIGAVPSRSGSLRISQPAATTQKSVTNAETVTIPVGANTGARMATLPGLNNISTKPKFPSSASAASVAELNDKLNDLAADVAALQNAGVDENAVRDIIDYELSNKDYATHPELNAVDAAKYDKETVDDKIAGIKPTAAIRYVDSTGDLQYKDSNDSWQTFANKSDFAGADGKSVVLDKTETEIRWKPEGADDSQYKTLVALEDIKGKDGKDAEIDETQLKNAVDAAIDDANLLDKDTADGLYADKDSVLPKNVKFAKQKIDNEDYYVLMNADTNTVIAPLAKVDDLQGEDGKEACQSLRLDPVSGGPSSDKQVYNLVCVSQN